MESIGDVQETLVPDASKRCEFPVDFTVPFPSIRDDNTELFGPQTGFKSQEVFLIVWAL